MRQHKNRGASRHRKVWAGRNECGKVAHPSRKEARVSAKNLPGERLRAYRCDGCGLWHLGHNARPVRRGEMTADEYYRRGRYAPGAKETDPTEGVA